MSEIKLNPKNITIDEVFRFVDTLDLNQSDGVCLKTMIWEVSQKPLQDVVERLKEMKEVYKKLAEKEMEKPFSTYDSIQENMYIDRMTGFHDAIEIVKEVGGMNESNC
jgi:hypothetical protein